MVCVEHDLAAGDVGDGVEAGILLDLHADRDAVAVAFGGLDAQELGVVLAEGLLGLELQPDRLAGRLAFERALERLQELAVAAVQIGEIGAGLQLDAVRVVQLDAHLHDRVLPYERRRLTTSNTSIAWPRGFTP